MADSVRIDKYLWAIRCFKTRSEAADACNGNKVRICGTVAKASKAVKAGDVIEVHKASVQYSYRVLKLTENRVGAQLVRDLVQDLTPQTELDKLHAPHETFFVRRERGTGRPTKKERRELDSLWESMDQD